MGVFRNQLPAIKHIQQLKLSFNPFDLRSGTARAALSPWSDLASLSVINNKYKFQADIGPHIDTPKIHVVYSDGKALQFDVVDMDPGQMNALIFKYAKGLLSKEAE